MSLVEQKPVIQEKKGYGYSKLKSPAQDKEKKGFTIQSYQKTVKVI